MCRSNVFHWTRGGGHFKSASCLTAFLIVDFDNRMTARLCRRLGDFDFSIVKFPCLHVCSYVLMSPIHNICVSRHIIQSRKRVLCIVVFKRRRDLDREVNFAGISAVSFGVTCFLAILGILIISFT